MEDKLQEKINTLKNSGHVVMAINLDGVRFVYSSLNRSEWGAIQKAIADAVASAEEGVSAKDVGENVIVMNSLVCPEITKQTIASYNAGTISQLADLVLKASGFDQLKEEPVKL